MFLRSGKKYVSDNEEDDYLEVNLLIKTSTHILGADDKGNCYIADLRTQTETRDYYQFTTENEKNYIFLIKDYSRSLDCMNDAMNKFYELI